LCFKTCVILRADNTSRLIDEYLHMFLRRYSSQRLPTQADGIVDAPRVVSLKKAIGPSRLTARGSSVSITPGITSPTPRMLRPLRTQGGLPSRRRPLS
jgi:hypothetical protein